MKQHSTSDLLLDVRSAALLINAMGRLDYSRDMDLNEALAGYVEEYLVGQLEKELFSEFYVRHVLLPPPNTEFNSIL